MKENKKWKDEETDKPKRENSRIKEALAENELKKKKDEGVEDMLRKDRQKRPEKNVRRSNCKRKWTQK